MKLALFLMHHMDANVPDLLHNYPLISSWTSCPQLFINRRKQEEKVARTNCLCYFKCLACSPNPSISPRLLFFNPTKLIISLPAHQTSTEVTVLGIRSCSPQPKQGSPNSGGLWPLFIYHTDTSHWLGHFSAYCSLIGQSLCTDTAQFMKETHLQLSHSRRVLQL